MHVTGKKFFLRMALAVGGVAVATVAAAQLGPSHHGMAKLFAEADLDKNGAVSLSEAQTARGTHFAEFDANADGAVSRDEMVAALTRRIEERAQKRFDRMDLDGDGQITQSEYSSIIEKRFSRADANSDGEITRQELRDAIKARHAGRYDRATE